jgi:amino acid transporter
MSSTVDSDPAGELTTAGEETDPQTGLAAGTLDTPHVLAESVGGMGPSLSAATIIPLAFGVAGYAAWFTTLIGTIGILALAFVVSTLAKRHVSVGALYTVIPKGLGSMGGLLAAGVFILVSAVIEITIIIGFALALSQFLQSAFHIGHGSRLELVIFGFIGVLVPAYVSLRGIKVSTLALLILEGLSIVAISVLLVIILIKHGQIFDSAQFTLKGGSVHGILLAVTYIVTSFGGFESATVLGVEAKDPRRAIPIAVIGSVIFTGLFFVVNAYVQVLGFQGSGLNITGTAVPLGALATHYGVGWLGDLVLAGVTIGWFSVSIAYINYSPRPLIAMAKEGVIPSWFGRTNERGVPANAAATWLVIWLVFYIALIVGGVVLDTAFGNLEALVGYAYTLLYLLMAIAGLGYAYKYGVRQAWFILAAVVAGAVLIIEYWFSFVPLPSYPLDVYAIAFAIFAAVLALACVAARIWAPNWISRIGRFEEQR